jgi:hypothetical protein
VVDEHLLEPDSFASLYTVWLDGADARRHGAERTLIETYRKAWESGDYGDQQAVLHFILLREEIEGFDLVVEGLRSRDARLAGVAEAVAFGLLKKGHDLGSQARDALREFSERFPEWADLGRDTSRHLGG